MAYTLVRVAFEDYTKWRQVFEEAAALRKAYGSRGVQVFRITGKPNEVVLLAEYDDVERARQLFRSQEFRDATKRAGVVRPPEVEFLEEAGRVLA
jgi:uncharacterized protein (DUF1330 family)